MSRDAERIIGLYDRYAVDWDSDRSRNLLERAWLDRFLLLVPSGGSILDLGCGSGEPIARYLVESGYHLTGVDSSAAMIDLCKGRFPQASWIVSDMRALSLARGFDGIIAWDSFFHLTAADQRAMFAIFGAHAGPNTALMFTSGPRHGIAIGQYQGEPLYHASLDPEEYRMLLSGQGFEVVTYLPEDPTCGGHTIWLARRNEPDPA